MIALSGKEALPPNGGTAPDVLFQASLPPDLPQTGAVQLVFGPPPSTIQERSWQ